MTKSTKSHIRGVPPLIYLPPCRLAATSANKVPRPSDYSLTTATGSKRLSADSDSLLCHVRLWRTSRFRFGCVSRCEHGEIWIILIVSSACLLHPRPPNPVSATPTHMLRICVNPLSAGVQIMRARICSDISCAMFARVVQLKPQRARYYRLPLYHIVAHTRHAWLARLTRARGGRFLRGRNALLNDFWYFWSLKSTINTI